MSRRLTDVELTAEEQREAEWIANVLNARYRVLNRRMAELLAGKGNRELVGETGFQVRDMVHELGAAGIVHERAYDDCRECRSGYFPTDEEFVIQRKQAPAAAEVITLTGVLQPFAERASPAVREEHRRLCGYVWNNLHRMDYPRYVAHGWPIGSGKVESACRGVVAQRLKGRGMRWRSRGTTAMASSARCTAANRPCGNTSGATSPANIRGARTRPNGPLIDQAATGWLQTADGIFGFFRDLRGSSLN